MTNDTVMTFAALAAALLGTATLFGFNFLVVFLVELASGGRVPFGGFLAAVSAGVGLPVAAAYLFWGRTRGPIR